jgi:hypothetical protein
MNQPARLDYEIPPSRPDPDAPGYVKLGLRRSIAIVAAVTFALLCIYAGYVTLMVKGMAGK